MRCNVAISVCWAGSADCVAFMSALMSVCRYSELVRIEPRVCILLVVMASLRSAVAPRAAICCCPSWLKFPYPLIWPVRGIDACWSATLAPAPVLTAWSTAPNCHRCWLRGSIPSNRWSEKETVDTGFAASLPLVREIVGRDGIVGQPDGVGEYLLALLDLLDFVGD